MYAIKKTLYIVILTIIFVFNALSQPASTWAKEIIHSAILNEDRIIWTKLPAGYDKEKLYTIAFVLDAEALFSTTLAAADSIKKQNKAMNNWIFIGLGNIWLRDRDYTTSHVNVSPGIDSNAAAISGGAENFTKFIEKELVPSVILKYRVQATVFIGHSYGGLLVMNTLIHHPGMFTYYVAIDPAMWWDDMKLLKELEAMGVSSFNNKTVFLAVANTMQKDMTETEIQADNSDKTALTRPGLRLNDFLNQKAAGVFRYHYKFYKDRDHMSIFPSAIIDALKFIINDGM